MLPICCKLINIWHNHYIFFILILVILRIIFFIPNFFILSYRFYHSYLKIFLKGIIKRGYRKFFAPYQKWSISSLKLAIEGGYRMCNDRLPAGKEPRDGVRCWWRHKTTAPSNHHDKTTRLLIHSSKLFN